MNIIFYFAKRSDKYQLIESYISSHDLSYIVGFFQQFLSICLWSYSIPWSNSIFPSNCWLFWYLYKQRQHSAGWNGNQKVQNFLIFYLFWANLVEILWEFFNHRPERRELWDKKMMRKPSKRPRCWHGGTLPT